MTSVDKRKQNEYEARIDELEQEQAKAQVSLDYYQFCDELKVLLLAARIFTVFELY